MAEQSLVIIAMAGSNHEMRCACHPGPEVELQSGYRPGAGDLDEFGRMTPATEAPAEHLERHWIQPDGAGGYASLAERRIPIDDAAMHFAHFWHHHAQR